MKASTLIGLALVAIVAASLVFANRDSVTFRLVPFVQDDSAFTLVTPLYFLVDLTGRHYAPPATYPQFFYGFFSVAMAWQIAFLVIASNPARFRPLMIPSMIEKFGHVATVFVLYSKSRIPAIDARAAVPDLLLGMIFVLAFAKSRLPDRDPMQASTPDFA